MKKRRAGMIVVLAAVLMAVFFGALALSIDAGMAYLNRTEMQRSADSAALAGALDLLHQEMDAPNEPQSHADAVSVAREFAMLNSVGVVSPLLADSDLTIGLVEDVHNRNSPLLASSDSANAVRVQVQRTNELNGETPFRFARVFGHDSVAQTVQATAVFTTAFRGFAVASESSCTHVEILPFALDVETWTAMRNNQTQDVWTYDKETGDISYGADGVLEVNLFPQDTGAPGNRGTVDIGHSGNSTNDIKRQILHGISAQDLAVHGGKLEFGDNGTLTLNGDTGISAAVKAELTQIKGQPRIIPIFSSVSGNGNNANYTIVKFVGVRVMEVKLTGKMDKKRVIIQPAPIATNCGIADTSYSHSYSESIFSPVRILN